MSINTITAPPPKFVLFSQVHKKPIRTSGTLEYDVVDENTGEIKIRWPLVLACVQQTTAFLPGERESDSVEDISCVEEGDVDVLKEATEAVANELNKKEE